MDDGAQHWSDRSQSLRLRSTDAAGKQKQRLLRLLTRRGPEHQQKTIAFVLDPADLRGVAFLQWERSDRGSEQWLYLPELKRTRQISSGLRDESFVGTDLSYRDLDIVSRVLRWTAAEADSELIGAASVDGHACTRIDFRLHEEGSPYGRVQLWLDDAVLVPRQIDLIGPDSKTRKRLRFSELRQIGQVPTPHHIEVMHLAKGSRTEVELLEVTYDRGLADELFTQRQLERGPP